MHRTCREVLMALSLGCVAHTAFHRQSLTQSLIRRVLPASNASLRDRKHAKYVTTRYNYCLPIPLFPGTSALFRGFKDIPRCKQATATRKLYYLPCTALQMLFVFYYSIYGRATLHTPSPNHPQKTPQQHYLYVMSVPITRTVFAIFKTLVLRIMTREASSLRMGGSLLVWKLSAISIGVADHGVKGRRHTARYSTSIALSTRFLSHVASISSY